MLLRTLLRSPHISDTFRFRKLPPSRSGIAAIPISREMGIPTFGNGKHVSVTPAGPAAGNPAQRIGI